MERKEIIKLAIENGTYQQLSFDILNKELEILYEFKDSFRLEKDWYNFDNVKNEIMIIKQLKDSYKLWYNTKKSKKVSYVDEFDKYFGGNE